MFFGFLLKYYILSIVGMFYSFGVIWIGREDGGKDRGWGLGIIGWIGLLGGMDGW